MSTLAIFGYGPGLGAGTAREFGRDGYRVAVIGRDAVAGAERAAALELPLALKVYSSIQLSRELLPGMIERGSGALLYSSGASERHLQPYLANVGVALGAQRAFVRQLAAEVEGTGVYVGLLAIGALIQDSAAQREIDAHPELIPEGLVLPRIGNAELGARYRRMVTERDAVEVEIGF